MLLDFSSSPSFQSNRPVEVPRSSDPCSFWNRWGESRGEFSFKSRDPGLLLWSFAELKGDERRLSVVSSCRELFLDSLETGRDVDESCAIKPEASTEMGWKR